MKIPHELSDAAKRVILGVRPVELKMGLAGPGFINLHMQEFPHVSMRVTSSQVHTLNKYALKFPAINLERLTPKRLKTLSDNLLRVRDLLRKSKASLSSSDFEFFRNVLQWTSNPGSFDLARKIMGHPLSKKYRKAGDVYRGMHLSKEEFDQLSTKGLALDNFSSWSHNVKTATQFGKNIHGISRKPMEGSYSVVFKRKNTGVILDVAALVKDRKDFVELAESGAFGKDLEPGTLWLGEVIVRPVLLTAKDVYVSHRYFPSGFRKL